MKMTPTPEVITPEFRNIFMALRKSKRDYNNYKNSDDSQIDFTEWLNENYGIRLFVSEDGFNLDNKIEISDEKKYMFFVLKYKS